MTAAAAPIVVPRAGAGTARLALRGLSGEEPPLAARAEVAWSAAGLDIAWDVAAEPPLVVDRTPAWANDCVEAFLADAATPWRYLEVVVDAAGALYTARVENPDGSRETWRVSPGAPPSGLEAAVLGEGPPDERRAWRARMRVPWPAIGVAPAAGTAFRGNLFRIARGSALHHLALSPTFRAAPPDFHVPARFAAFTLA